MERMAIAVGRTADADHKANYFSADAGNKHNA